MSRSPFIAVLPDGVLMAFAVGTPLGDVILAAAYHAHDEGEDVQIYRDEDGTRWAICLVHPDGTTTEA